MTSETYTRSDSAISVEPLVINFWPEPAIVEIGDMLGTIVLRWELSKTPIELFLNNVQIPLNAKDMLLAGPFGEPVTWTLKTTDQYESNSKKTTLLFQNKFYWQNLPVVPATSADILAMENAFFRTDYVDTYQVGSPNGKQPCFAWPKRFAAPRKVMIGVPNPLFGPDEVIWSVFTDYTLTTVSFTNSKGFTEDYYVLAFNAPVFDNNLLVQLI